MNRCKVICHMYSSIDGKIDGDYMTEKSCDISGNYYDDIIFKMGNGMASGKNTALMYHALGHVDLNKYSNDVSLEDYIIKNDYYHFVFDRHGSCIYEFSKHSYGGKLMQIVEVLTKDVKKEYLSYLQKMKISYIIVDKENYLNEALIKIKKLFGVDNLILTGGALINGGFYKENLIDEISLVVAPLIDGNKNNKSFVESDIFSNQVYAFSKVNKLEDGGIQLIFEKKL